MSETTLATTITAIAATGRITADDILALRRAVYGDGWASRAEVESLFRLDRTCAARCAEWTGFFIEAASDYVVNQEKPHGHVSRENADWLIGQISNDGVVVGLTELEMLVRVLEKAKSSPDQLSAYALGQVALAVVEGAGPLADGGELIPGAIGKAEVDLLRRILFAFGGDGNIAITQAEADILLEINDRTAAEANHPSWNELFVKAVANFVLAASGYEPPGREEALRHEAFLDNAGIDLGGFFARMVSGGFGALMSAYEKAGDAEAEWGRLNRRREDTASRVDAGEAKWLAEKFGNRPLHENERAVLAFIGQHARSVHPDIAPLLGKSA